MWENVKTPLQEIFAVVTFASALTKVFALHVSITDSIYYLTHTVETPNTPGRYMLGGGGDIRNECYSYRNVHRNTNHKQEH